MVILISLDTSAVGLLVYGYINITGYICCRTISLCCILGYINITGYICCRTISLWLY